MDIKQIENLLEKAEIIKNKYDDLAEYTGENFNVFNILRLDEKELMHSAFIANLLNVKGDHKQKDIFLKLFIDEIKGSFLENEENRKSLEKFDTLNSSAQEEEYIGKVDYESDEGGRIDIVVKDGNNVILIENKIGAGDQEAQLCRYYNYYTDSSIIYLTPYGSEPSESSKGHLENNKDFICISYEQHIVNWIENCIKEMAKKPIIRETLNQYLHLVKQITNQTTNNKMEKELTDLILSNEKNYNAYHTLLQNQNEITQQLVNESSKIFVEEVLKVVAKNNNLTLKISDDLTEQYSGISFLNSTILKDLEIEIQFQRKNLETPVIACSITHDNGKNENQLKLKHSFDEAFHNISKKEHHWFIFYLDERSNDMAVFNKIDLKTLKFNHTIIPQLVDSLDDIVKRIIGVVQNKYV